MKKTLSLLLALSLAACGKSVSPAEGAASPLEDSQMEASKPGEPSGALADGRYPLTITTYNYAKEEVTYIFEKASERVWVQSQDNIEILLALGLKDKIVGAYGLDSEIRLDLAADFAEINCYENMPSKEEIIVLEPDFITGWYSTFSDKRLGDVDFWHQRGVGTYMTLNSGCRGPAAENPQTVEHECQDILTLGQIFDVEERAQELVDEIHQEPEKIEAYLAGKTRLTAAVL